MVLSRIGSLISCILKFNFKVKYYEFKDSFGASELS